MQAGPLYKKLFKIALITSPLFGLFGATPGLTSHEFEWDKVLRFFSFITIFTFYLWGINILLVKLCNSSSTQKNNILRYIISGLISIITLYILFKLISPGMPRHHVGIIENGKIKPFVMPNTRMVLMPMIQGLAINLIVIVLTEIMLLKETKLKVDTENEQLKLFNLEARNSQLKQQLHPHFLFNSLSTLRSLINRSPEKAEAYLEKLSELLRFSTDNNNQSLVTLKEEAELCTNYLAMQQTRFGEALQYRISIPEALQENGKVPVFALQQLAENAIKHNVLTKESPLFVNIEADETGRWVIIKNNFQPKQSIEHSSNVGLANLSERYRLTGSDDIVIKNDNGIFSVAIKILDHEGDNN
ncbi:MAG: histidine kinase [Bacteroidota bacterium]